MYFPFCKKEWLSVVIAKARTFWQTGGVLLTCCSCEELWFTSKRGYLVGQEARRAYKVEAQGIPSSTGSTAGAVRSCYDLTFNEKRREQGSNFLRGVNQSNDWDASSIRVRLIVTNFFCNLPNSLLRLIFEPILYSNHYGKLNYFNVFAIFRRGFG